MIEALAKHAEHAEGNLSLESWPWNIAMVKHFPFLHLIFFIFQTKNRLSCAYCNLRIRILHLLIGHSCIHKRGLGRQWESDSGFSTKGQTSGGRRTRPRLVLLDNLLYRQSIVILCMNIWNECYSDSMLYGLFIYIAAFVRFLLFRTWEKTKMASN